MRRALAWPISGAILAVMPTLAVVGAGPKGIAIAAKARALGAAGLAAPRGPGFPNLSCLGLMSDRVLRRYVTPAQPARMNRQRRELDRGAR